MSPAGRKAPTRRKSKAAPKKREGTRQKPKASLELRRAAERDVSRAKALEAAYRPLHEAAQAELQKTSTGRKVLAEAHALAKDLGDLFKSITSRKTRRYEGALRAGERLETFRQRYGEQLLAARAQHIHLQPSVEAVAQILRPEMAARTTWVSETSFMRALLLRPKTIPEDVGTVSQGLGGDNLPPTVQSCVIPPYSRGGFDEEYLINATISTNLYPTLAGSHPDSGRVVAAGETWVSAGVPFGTCLASAFVGQDFPVPAGPTSYTTTITYDWHCDGGGFAFLGIAIVNCDLAIVIDKRDGTRETYAREITLLTLPGIGGDGFNHDAENVSVTIPFARDGSNGTVRIMVGADGQGTVVAPGFACGAVHFWAEATVRQICLTSVG